MTTQSAASSHTWQFFRAGGLDQVKLETGGDLAHLRQLDPKLWIALACPTKGLEFEQRTLELIDTDQDGRIRVPEILAAVEWVLARLKSGDSLARGDAPLVLADLAADRPEGQAILATAKQILAALGKPDATTLAVADVADNAKIFAQTRFNGDGIIPADAASDAATKQAIGEIIATVGAKPDRSGLPGIDAALTAKFFAEAQALADWWTKADQSVNPVGGIHFLGDRTGPAFAALQAVRAKIDDYFNRCHLAAFDQRAGNHLNRPESELAALAAKDLSTLGADMAALPLAQVVPGRPLPLLEGINPAWTSAIAAFRSQVVSPILGIARTALTEGEWHDTLAKFAAHAAWNAATWSWRVARTSGTACHTRGAEAKRPDSRWRA